MDRTPSSPPEPMARRPAPRTPALRRAALLVAAPCMAAWALAAWPLSPTRSAAQTRTATRRLERAELARLAQAPLAAALHPCEVDEVDAPRSARVPSGPLTVRGEGTAPTRSGRVAVAAAVVVESGSRAVRVPVRVRLDCPEPVVGPGSQVRVVAVVGAVRASAPGEARQTGRVGDVIVVINRATETSLRARVVDANTVEVVR